MLKNTMNFRDTQFMLSFLFLGYCILFSGLYGHYVKQVNYTTCEDVVETEAIFIPANAFWILLAITGIITSCNSHGFEEEYFKSAESGPLCAILLGFASGTLYLLMFAISPMLYMENECLYEVCVVMMTETYLFLLIMIIGVSVMYCQKNDHKIYPTINTVNNPIYTM